MSNVFGRIFRIVTWGESHGSAMGVVIDGCPAGLEITTEEIQNELDKRAPGKHPNTSPRKEPDKVEILSGIYEGKTTGAPICLLVKNEDANSKAYEPLKNILRPGHASFTYLEKYGVFDPRGGGRASARETVGRVAAGAVAKKFLQHFSIRIETSIEEIGGYCEAKEIEDALQRAKTDGDSLGGILKVVVTGLPAGLGDPIYGKIEARLAEAMLSLPATKGFEIGEGFAAARMRGSEHNDSFVLEEEKVRTRTNHSGGTLGGITTGMPLYFRVAFKPTSSIRQQQTTLTKDKQTVRYELPEQSRHDPCVAIRAVPIVEAMTALVFADALLLNRLARL